jgi:hypothetical protein
MLDLLFIIFDSANLSLAFDTLFDVRWSCRSSADFKDGSNVWPMSYRWQTPLTAYAEQSHRGSNL